MDIPATLKNIRSQGGITQTELAHILGVSLVCVNRWEQKATLPNQTQKEKIIGLYQKINFNPQTPKSTLFNLSEHPEIFASRGIRKHSNKSLTKYSDSPEIRLSEQLLPPIIDRLTKGKFFSQTGETAISEMLKKHNFPALTVRKVPTEEMSAGKNTYTYDAHTYHTKVPPQGIAELIKHYLPSEGLVLDIFAGSGMTGVASIANGYDCILNELSPAACFIANRFTTSIDPVKFLAALDLIIKELQNIREKLYTTTCRECGKQTEILYTVWSYRVICNCCNHEFLLWDYCRKYGNKVREHKILKEFPCPSCKSILKKSRLKRTIAEPVQIGYKCCGSRQKEVNHPPDNNDLKKIREIEINPPLADSFYPKLEIPNGVNLQQPKNHGLHRIDLFYTPRNLAALSHIWKIIHYIEDEQIAAHLAFVFTSLYQRVTRLSEFRFWGGSGNTPRFNVPYIFNESNVFLTFIRKARTIHDHLLSTAYYYSGKAVVVQNSATQLDYLPDECIDLIFTDPPFGANINYSEMNIIWESWLNKFTNTTEEAIINKVQNKDVRKYQELITKSLKEAYRVLRKGHWMLLVFMNSSSEVWQSIKESISVAGFEIKSVSVFDKQHGTFKHFVAGDTPGCCDLVIHCWKPESKAEMSHKSSNLTYKKHIIDFLSSLDLSNVKNTYLHVQRDEETDFRRLYSEWMKQALLENIFIPSFKEFCGIIKGYLNTTFE